MNSSDKTVEKPISLDSIPEDVALGILKVIKGWAEKDSFSERRGGRKLRDSTLVATALSCTETFRFWYPALIQNISFSFEHLLCLHFRLTQGWFALEDGYGGFVKSLHFKPMSDDIDDEDFFSLKLAFIPSSEDRISEDELDEKIEQAIFQVVEEIYNSLIHLEALFLDDPFLFFPFQTRINGSLVPPQFLSHLKVLYIPLWSSGEGQSLNPNLNASNVVWLLLQCSQLEEASFGLSYSMNDFKTISEASEAFSGKSSVKKLSLSIDFVQLGPNRSAVWDHYGKGTKDWKGGNQRTEALVHLLQATDQLQALEVILSSLSSDTPQEGSSLCADFLSFLHRSFNSLKHLRLLGVDLGDTALSPRVLHPFQSMTLLTVDQPMILGFKERKHSCLLPPNLKAIYLPYYVIMHKTDTDVDFLEELWLAEFVNVIPSAQLKEVIVPLKAIDGNQKPWVKSRRRKAGWDAKRKRVENVDIFKSGKVRLRFVEPSDEFVGDVFQGEVFMSCLNWLSPFL